MIGSPPFPMGVHELTAEFLTEALGSDVSAFDTERIGADRGMLGDIYRLKLQYANGSGPRVVVAKFAADREGSLATARRSLNHERELRCYDELLGRTPVATPEMYGAWYDPTTARFLLLQAAVDNDPTIDQINGLDQPRARLVLDQVARLHATWWGEPTLESLEWLPRLDSEQRRTNLTTLAATGWAPMCELVDDLTPEERALGDEFPERLDRALCHVASLPSTLVHSDLRTDNLLFAPDGSSVSLVDWQGAGLGPPSFDLAYFLSQCLTPDDRRRHEDGLIEYYRHRLAAAGVDLSTAQVREGYAESMLFGLTIATALPLISDPDEPRVRALTRTVARRSIEALRDHDQLWTTS